MESTSIYAALAAVQSEPQDIRWRNSLPSCRDRHRILRQDARSHV